MGKSLSGIALCLILSALALNPAHGKILTTPDGGRYTGYSEAYTKRVDLGFKNDELVFTLSD
jgi:hypothetical protein